MVDLFLSLRDVKAHAAMIDLYHRMPLPLQRAKMMREQLGFALNREGRFEDAEKVLNEVIAEFGPSSETNALLGRIYKDRWDVAKKQGLPEARALLKNAIDTYLAGFEADWRDAYPGINAVTLDGDDAPSPTRARPRSCPWCAIPPPARPAKDARLLGPRHAARACRAGPRRRRRQ